jgi:putative transposase
LSSKKNIALFKMPRYALRVKRASRQLELPVPNGWGGRRAGAGRPKSVRPRPNVPHRARPMHIGRHPVHITLRAGRVGASFRQERVLKLLKAALARVAALAEGFQVVHYSVQRDHIHFIAEAVGGADRAETERRLRRGVAGLAVSLAKRLNGMLRRRGAVWADRHHRRELETPSEVRRALLYVLKNGAHHGVMAADVLDPFSSAGAHGSWSAEGPTRDTEPWMRRARTWLLRVGWLRAGGPLRRSEMPRLAM